MTELKLYRFSPIKDEAELMRAIEFLHGVCAKLCKQAMGKYLPVAGNVGIFCHYGSECAELIEVRDALTEQPDNSQLKYFQLKEPIVIAARDDIPEATYTHLYIRKPDPYRAQVGDIDFIMSADEYAAVKRALENNKETMPGARIYPRPELDMIELHDPDIDALGYVCTRRYN